MGYPYKLGQEHTGPGVTAHDLWEGFKESTTVHGIPHVSGASEKIKKGVWFIISLIAVGWLSYHMYFICSLYFSYSTNIKITISQEHIMDFPAVTLCNLNSIKRSKINIEPVIEALLRDDVITKKKKKRRKRYSDSNPICLSTDRFQQSTGLCYRLFNNVKLKLAPAEDVCTDLGGTVYMPLNQERVDFMKSTDLFAVKGVNSYWNFMQNDKWANDYEIIGYKNYNPAKLDTSKDSSHSVVSDNHRWHSAKRDKDEDTTYTLCQHMVECPHTPYDPDGDGIGFCWFMPFGSQELNSWQVANKFCEVYDPRARLMEPDSLAKLNYFVQSTSVLDGATNIEYWINYEKTKWKSDDRIASWTNFASDATINHNDDGPVVAYIDDTHKWKYGFKNDRTKTAAMIICEIDLPVIRIFGTTTQVTTVEDTTIQDTTIPETTIVDTTIADTTIVDTTIPDTTIVDTTIPDTTIADTRLDDTTIVDTTKPDTTIVDTTIPDTTIADTTLDDTTIVDTTIAETTIPDTSIKDTTIQDTTIHETTIVDTTIADTTLLDTSIRDTTIAETTTIHDTTLMESTTLQSTKFDTTIPDTTVVNHVPTTAISITTVPPTTISESTVRDTTMPATTMDVITTLLPTTLEEITTVKSSSSTTFNNTTPTPLPTTTTTTTTTTTSSEVRLLNLKESFVLHETVLENLAVIPENTKAIMGYERDELLLDCTYEGVECSRNDFTKFYNPDLGNCYIFNSGWYDNIKLYKARKTGRLYGLSVVINIGEDDYIKKLGGASGAKILVHNQNEMPHPDEDGLLLETGKVVSIGLRKVLIERLSTPYGNCTDIYQNKENDVFSEKYPVKYSAKDCKKTCYQRNLIKKCLCADSRFPYTGTAFQGIHTHPCDTNNVTEANCKYVINNAYISGELGCNEECTEVCSESYYTFDVSMAKWPSIIHKEKIIEEYQPLLTNLNLSLGDALQRNLLTVEVYFEDFNYEKIQEIPAYNIGQFASDIGGLLGLWLGMSVITVFEFFEFAVDLFVFSFTALYFQCTKNRKKLHMSSLTKIVPSPASSQVISVHHMDFSLNHSDDKTIPITPLQRPELRRKSVDYTDSPYISKRRIHFQRKRSRMAAVSRLANNEYTVNV